jgi:hypothetical protein
MKKFFVMIALTRNSFSRNTFDKRNEIHAAEVGNSLNLLSKRGRRQTGLKASKTLQELTSAGRACTRFMTGLIIPTVMNKTRPAASKWNM